MASVAAPAIEERHRPEWLERLAGQLGRLGRWPW